MDDTWHVAGLTVGQVAARMQIARSAVRWYADQGLLPCERTGSNERRFLADVLCRVAMIRAAQRVGLTLQEIREALATLPPGRPPAPEDWNRLAARLREVLVDRIEQLFSLLDEMAPRTTMATTPSAGRPGDNLTKPAHAGFTNAPDSAANTPWSASKWRLPY
jgi:MerR family transcriptional regulator, redox-sensitive transcriptional activator SoxR